ncbi:hypothetical protein M3Y95_01202200 [Aphelenchoides besseyi]|nr:hypothetical protein M3Y95_01202200 [Aphelenchoides besseyi]
MMFNVWTRSFFLLIGIIEWLKAVKEGDFNEYLEVWDLGYGSIVFMTTNQSGIGEIIESSGSVLHDHIVMPVFNESRYFYSPVFYNDVQLDYQFISTHNKPFVAGCEATYEEPDRKLMEDFKYQFFFYNMLFVNGSHFIYADKLYDQILENSANQKQMWIRQLPALNYIAEIPNYVMTPFIKKQVITQCQRKYCVFNMDAPGSAAIWQSDTEHYVQYKHDMFVIFNEKTENNPSYYTMKHRATNKYFYFDENLITFPQTDPQFQQRLGGDYKKRVLVFPIINENDRFFQTRDL